MKYILTNQWIEITEKEGTLPNNSVLYPILLAASTTWPDANTPYKAIASSETQNFKAAENEKMYLRLFTNNNDAQFEISVVTFIPEIPEQIQNCSKKLPEGTILAVDYRKGVTAQDYDGNLIEPNGIETTLGHDSGVFYNADGSFQGQRDRVRGLWAGKGTNNLAYGIDSGAAYLTAIIGNNKYSCGEVTAAGVTYGGVKFSHTPYANSTEYFISLIIKTENNCEPYSYYNGNAYIVIPNESKIDLGGGKWKLNITFTTFVSVAVAIFHIKFIEALIEGGTVEIWDFQMEQFPIATPFCEKNRGDYQMSYPCELDLRTDTGFFVRKFWGKNQKGTWNGDTYYILGSKVETDDTYAVAYISSTKIDELNALLNDGENVLIFNFTGGITDTYVNGTQVTFVLIATNIQLTAKDGIVYFDRSASISNSDQFSPCNFTKKTILGLGRNLTAEEIELYSNSDIDIPDVGEYYPVAFSKKRTNDEGVFRNFYEVTALDDDIRAVKAGEVIKVQGADLTEYLAKVEDNLAITGTGVIDVSGYIRLDAGVALPAKVWVMK